jgi:hypothetical protein
MVGGSLGRGGGGKGGNQQAFDKGLKEATAV